MLNERVHKHMKYVLKKIKKQQYNKMQYGKTREKKRQYYQEKKGERNAYQLKNRREKQEYDKKHYEENREKKLEYQRKYDKEHKQEKKEYRKLKSHYIKYANRMESKFQVDDISHFKSHVNGWCNWTKKNSSHYHCWENVPQQCEMCHKGMFQLKCNTEWNGPYEINALHCISCTQVQCKLCGEHIQDYNYFIHFYITGINSALKDVANF